MHQDSGKVTFYTDDELKMMSPKERAKILPLPTDTKGRMLCEVMNRGQRRMYAKYLKQGMDADSAATKAYLEWRER